MLYELLVLRRAFAAASFAQLADVIASGNYNEERLEVAPFQRPLKALTSKHGLLNRDPAKRTTLPQLLASLRELLQERQQLQQPAGGHSVIAAAEAAGGKTVVVEEGASTVPSSSSSSFLQTGLDGAASHWAEEACAALDVAEVDVEHSIPAKLGSFKQKHVFASARAAAALASDSEQDHV